MSKWKWGLEGPAFYKGGPPYLISWAGGDQINIRVGMMIPEENHGVTVRWEIEKPITILLFEGKDEECKEVMKGLIKALKAEPMKKEEECDDKMKEIIKALNTESMQKKKVRSLWEWNTHKSKCYEPGLLSLIDKAVKGTPEIIAVDKMSENTWICDIEVRSEVEKPIPLFRGSHWECENVMKGFIETLNAQPRQGS